MNHRRTGTDDAEIEAIVAEAIAAEAAMARTEAAPPSSAIVWWRAQMRARQEAAQSPRRPITIVHGLAIASRRGADAEPPRVRHWRAEGLAGVARGGVYQSRRPAAPLAAIDLTSRWVMLPMTAMLVSALVATVAAYVIFADE